MLEQCRILIARLWRLGGTTPLERFSSHLRPMVRRMETLVKSEYGLPPSGNPYRLLFSVPGGEERLARGASESGRNREPGRRRILAVLP